MNNLPQEFLDRMKLLLDSEYESYISSYSDRPTIGVRVNTLKLDMEEFIRLFPYSFNKIPWSEYGLYYNGDERLGINYYHRAGLYYLQDPSAMLAVEVLNPCNGEKVLDMCAAPGGKATYIAQKMNNTGLLIANEIVLSRAKILRENIERLGITNTVILNESPTKLAKNDNLNCFFDKILVDAPCSGEGMFRKDKKAVREWSLERVMGCSIRQLDILSHSSTMLRSGGRMVYSTCTMSPEENEGVISRFLELHPEFDMEKMVYVKGSRQGITQWQDETYDNSVARAVRMYPHNIEGEGHFVASLIKNCSSKRLMNIKYLKKLDDKKLFECYHNFKSRYILKDMPSRLMIFKDNIYIIPEYTPSLDGLKTLAVGLNIGVIRKGNFIPQHHLAMSLNSDEYSNVYNLCQDEDIAQYLKGDILNTPIENGWVLITINKYPLGWGKVVCGTIKNHYPKYLRR